MQIGDSCLRHSKRRIVSFSGSSQRLMRAVTGSPSRIRFAMRLRRGAVSFRRPVGMSGQSRLHGRRESQRQSGDLRSATMSRSSSPAYGTASRIACAEDWARTTLRQSPGAWLEIRRWQFVWDVNRTRAQNIVLCHRFNVRTNLLPMARTQSEYYSDIVKTV